MTTKKSESGKNDPKRRALSNYLTTQFASLGHTVNSFAVEYGLPQRSLNALIRCEHSPSVSTLARLANALTEATGKEITAGMLGDVTEDGEISIVSAPIVRSADFDGDALIQGYKSLPFEKQVEIAPELIRLATEALEISTAKTQRKIAILVEKERSKSGKGSDLFARKNGLNPDVAYGLIQEAEVAPTWSEVQKISEKIRDESGNYGNLVLFSKLLRTSQMPALSSLLNAFMEDNDLHTVAQLAGRLIKDNQLQFDKTDRQRFIAGLEKLASGEKQVNVWDPELSFILPAISYSLGFGRDVSQLIKAICED